MKSLQCHSISPKSILKSHSPEVCYIFSMVFYILYKHGDMSICMHTWYIFSHKIRIIPCLMVFMVSCFFLNISHTSYYINTYRFILILSFSFFGENSEACRNMYNCICK